MGCFSAATALSTDTKKALEELAAMGSSEASAVADCLNTIAENGGEQAEDLFLMNCAMEMAAYCHAFVNSVKPPLFEALMLYASLEQPANKPAVIMKGGQQPGVTAYLQGSPTWTAFGERAYVFASPEDAQRLLDWYPEELEGAKVLERS